MVSAGSPASLSLSTAVSPAAVAVILCGVESRPGQDIDLITTVEQSLLGRVGKHKRQVIIAIIGDSAIESKREAAVIQHQIPEKSHVLLSYVDGRNAE